MTLKWLISGISLSFFVSVALAQSPKTYCSGDAERYDIHLFGYTFQDLLAKKMSKKMLMDFRLKLEVGDNLRVFSHTPSGYSVTFDQCLPGCPEVGTLAKFFSKSCSDTVVKRDLRHFDSSFAVQALETYEILTPQYDIFKSFRQLTDALRSSSEAKNVYALISMVPAGVDPNNRRDLNVLYRSVKESTQLTDDLPVINLVGPSPSGEVQEFWSDLLGGKSVLNFARY